jgi:aryl-alcohol dehydrogenase-like predicted oxidoreductase
VLGGRVRLHRRAQRTRRTNLGFLVPENAARLAAMANHATPEGTAAYGRRFSDRLLAGHFRHAQGLMLASIGLGTYLGDADDITDAAYRAAVETALWRGCNVIDSAINYRFQRSERAIGTALAAAFASATVQREEVVIATKGGYLSFDSAPPRDPSRWFHDTFVATGVATPDDLVAGCHCMTASYLRHQLAASRHNLRLDCIDIYYLHNPETQLGEVGRDEFEARIRAAFTQLEEAVGAGEIRMYGVATWNGLRQPEHVADHLSLQNLVRLATEVGGPDHHFRVVQAPFNPAMPEALTRHNQHLDGEKVSLLTAAERMGITVMASASLLQGRLTRGLPQSLSAVLTGLDTDAQRAIQFVRSAPGMTTALVGMKQTRHVEENLAAARLAPLDETSFWSLFRESGPGK